MILPKQELLSLTGLSDSFNLEFTHEGVEREIKNYCGWELESATYTNQVIDGSGGQWIWPGPKNITSLVRASRGRDTAIRIKHSTLSSNAYARVNYTDNTPISLQLVVDDGTDVSDTTDTFANFATMTLLVDQINASSANWTAELDDTDLAAFASTNLLEVDNRFAGTLNGDDPGWTDLWIPGEPVADVRLERTEGGLSLSSGWPDGVQNITLTYTAGWTTADMPFDLKQAVAVFTNFFYNRNIVQGATGIKSFSLGHLRIEYELGGSSTSSSSVSSIPISVLDILDAKYRIDVTV